MQNTNQVLTQQEFTPQDHRIAARVAKALGYTEYVYTSTSALVGTFCKPVSPLTDTGPRRGVCIINTKELGFLIVQDLEDLNLQRLEKP